MRWHFCPPALTKTVLIRMHGQSVHSCTHKNCLDSAYSFCVRPESNLSIHFIRQARQLLPHSRRNEHLVEWVACGVQYNS